MAKTIRLTESELRSMIVESLIKEIGDTDRGQELLGRAAGRAQKKAQNIGRSNDFDGYCKSMSKADKIGNYARDARIKTTGKADDVNGAFTRGVKHSKQVLSEFNSVLPYGNHSSRESVKGSYELDANTLLSYLSKDNECNPICDEVKDIIEMVLDGCIIEFEGTLYREEDTNYSEVENVILDDSSVDFCISEIDNFDEVSDNAKAMAKELLNNVVNDIDSNDIDWE